MTVARVGDIADQIRGVTYSKGDASGVPLDTHITLLRAMNIGDSGLLMDDLIYVPKSKVSQRQLLRPNDVLIAASSGSLSVVGKAARVAESIEGSFGAFCKVLRPRPGVDPAYFAHFFRTSKYRRHISSVAAGANINNLRGEDLDQIEIPLPPLPEQRRIAAILDEADTLREQSPRRPQLVRDFEEAQFLQSFGDPRSVPSRPLLELVRVQSGSTPSKARPDYWAGPIPWVSPKDMKARNLFDAIDHVSEAAVKETSVRLVPPDTVAIVVRGMILAHTFPVARLRVASTINQDMKALIPREPIDPAFLASAIRLQSASILGAVSVAGHGTRRLDAEALDAIRLPVATREQQAEFGAAVAEAESVAESVGASARELDALFASLQHRAFRGEL